MNIQIKTLRKRSVAAGVVVALASLVFAGIASAHTHVAESSPAAGARVDAAPAEVMVRFGDEYAPVQPGAVQDAYLEVYDACGKQVDKGDSTLTMQDSRVVVSSGGDVAGRYEIHWHATAADGAAQAGVIDFTVTKGSPCATAVRVDPAKDVDLGFDVVRLDSKRIDNGPLVRVTTAAPVACSDLTKKQTLELNFDTNSDQSADMTGSFKCRDGRMRLHLSGDDGPTGVLSVSRPSSKVLAVKITRHVLLGHVEVFARSSSDSEECAERVCADRAPDLGALRAF